MKNIKIGFAGTGLLGFPMAEKLLEAGYVMNVFNRTIEKAAPLEKSGAVLYTDVGKMCEVSECIIIMLSDGGAIKDVFEDVAVDLSGRTVIQMSTIAPHESTGFKEMFEKKGAEYFEAPVLGSIPQAKSRTLITLVGAAPAQYEAWKNIFRAFSDRIEYIGEVGKASAFKLGLNQLIVGLTTIFSMSLGYVREKELDVDKFMDIVRESALYAPTFDKKLPKMIERDFSNPHFPLKHLLKDLNLMIDEFGSSGINVETLKGIHSVLTGGIRKGNSEDDYSSLYNTIHPAKD
jgi:3-hydroxyisobutyrate dehydrogenase